MTARSIENTEAPRSEPHRRTNGELRRAAGVCLLVLLMAAATGCEIFGVIANAFFPEKIKARYRLEDRPTLVLVDDSSASLGNPALLNLIAHTITTDLAKQKKLSDEHAVSTHKLYELASRLGGGYARTPIDHIGTELGAQQVIHVDIKSVHLLQEPGLYRPIAATHVRVIDARQGKKLFPQQHDGATPDASSNPRHETVTVTLRRSSVHSGEQAETQLILRLLCERIGHEVAKLFYDYLPRQPGDPFED